MRLNADEVRKIATLAKLELSSEEEELFTAQLTEVVDYFDQLEDFETSPPAPARVGAAEADDEAVPGLDREAFLANAPESFEGFLVMPQVKVVGDEP